MSNLIETLQALIASLVIFVASLFGVTETTEPPVGAPVKPLETPAFQAEKINIKRIQAQCLADTGKYCSKPEYTLADGTKVRWDEYVEPESRGGVVGYRIIWEDDTAWNRVDQKTNGLRETVFKPLIHDIGDIATTTQKTI